MERMTPFVWQLLTKRADKNIEDAASLIGDDGIRTIVADWHRFVKQWCTLQNKPLRWSRTALREQPNNEYS